MKNTEAFGEAVQETVQSAHSRIWILAYFISGGSHETIQAIYNTVREKARTGLDTLVISEFGKGTPMPIRNATLNYAQTLEENGVNVRFIQEYRTMHKKVILVDRDKVLLGSANLTGFGVSYSDEFSILIQSEPFARSVEADINRIENNPNPLKSLTIDQGGEMNLYYRIIPLIITFVMCAPMTGWAGANPNAPYCEHDPACWEPNDDPSTWYGADCCRPKEDGTEAEVDGVAGRCCGGLWYEIDQAKEESECWEWDDSTCEYVCSDVPGPEIAAEEVQIVELECSWSTEPLPALFATATDHCGNTVSVEQSPEGGGGAYGDGESATITLTAIDECERTSTVEVVVRYGYQCPEYEAHKMAKVNLISAFWAQGRICESARVLWKNREDAFEELKETLAVVGIGLQEMCNYFGIVDPGNASYIVGIGVADILNRQYENITALVESLQGVCDEWSDAYSALQQAYQEYLETIIPECISRCFTPGPPLDPHCRP